MSKSDFNRLMDLLYDKYLNPDKVSISNIERAILELRENADLMKKKAEERRLAEEEKNKKLEEERLKKLAEEEAAQKAHAEEVTSMDLPLDWDNFYMDDERSRGVHAESIQDGLVMSLTTLGKVDIEYISSITGEDYKTIITTLKGAIYQNPDTWGECFFKGWETADEYLSGNIRQKLRTATQANKDYYGYFQDNVDAISKILPPVVAADDIYVTLGSPWVPTEIIDDFIDYLFGEPCISFSGSSSYQGNHDPNLKTVHDEATGTWEIPYKSRFYHSVAVRGTYGTDRLEGLYILEKTLNMKTVSVTDEVQSAVTSSGKARVINKKETLAAIEKQKKMIQEFRNWVWKDASRASRLKSIFENKYACLKRRMYNGSFLNFPGMSEKVSLYPYQKNAVARIIFSPNTLLAHDVGAGKTYTMIAAGQELKRMGLSKKNMYVVPNNIVLQWKDIFMSMYPNAKILVVEPKNFTPGKRQAILEDIRDLDYDGIIIAYSCFSLIPISREYYKNELILQKKIVENTLKMPNKANSRLKKKKEKIQKELDEIVFSLPEGEKQVYFDELGITRLFVDEAHNFKNVPIETQTDNVLGISAAGSKKCRDMLEKVHIVQKNNDGKGVVFATGTPITNSLTDAFIMQTYLQSGELAMLDLQSFDGWIGMFTERVTDFEIDVDTNSYRMATRFSKFHNLPELTALLSSIADFHQLGDEAGIPEHDGYVDTLIPKTPDFQAYLDNISKRADDVRLRRVGRKDDNMLKITTDGRKAALDLRLADDKALFTLTSKVMRCAENAANIYNATGSTKGTQLVFCDISTPKNGFNMYDELKRLLLRLGVPEQDIAYIHDAGTDAVREKLFEKVRKGEIRILIGSTLKLGLGVNVQEHLVAMHHLDVPWRPADMTQREGRILRQGNLNKKVFIYRYITEGSFDAYSWQLLETKQKFITDILSGSLSVRSGTDVDDTVLDYAEVKALAVGNPLVKQRVEAANELMRYTSLQNSAVEAREAMEKELLELPPKISHQKEMIDKCERDRVFSFDREIADWNAARAKKNALMQAADAEKRKSVREKIHKALLDNELKSKEHELMIYRGFNVVLPANMVTEKPFVYLQHDGKYSVELGDNEIGNLIRIDNFIDDFGKYLDKLRTGLAKFEDRKKDLEIELAKEENYLDQIENYKQKVADLDRQLGVTK